MKNLHFSVVFILLVSLSWSSAAQVDNRQQIDRLFGNSKEVYFK
ncbi:MAG: hypothetical protein WCK34_14410 [Bacteroidota bacterium]